MDNKGKYERKKMTKIFNVPDSFEVSQIANFFGLHSHEMVVSLVLGSGITLRCNTGETRRAGNNHPIDGDRGVQELFRTLQEDQRPLQEKFRQQKRHTLREVKAGVNLNIDNRRPESDKMHAEGFAQGQLVAYNVVRRHSHYLPDYEDDSDDEGGELYNYHPRKRHTYYYNYFSKVDISYFNGDLPIDKFLDWILEIDKLFEIMEVDITLQRLSGDEWHIILVG
ncbi:hypothetical protein QJS04_geneDACA021676 [Acorus gramineus]|uniref:Uncharacterized protein n=1 Tax=Acorus gramineus TaxID=55184 RepID=A0AAV9A1P3_ACOGR|nr:hypothetical protein QJS04_geneDACA021676 [Acorus gramineus]